MEKLNNTATPEVIIKMKGMIPQLSPAMQKLAKFIIDNFGTLDGIQIQQLAKLSGVSEATITRFVKEIGFRNYQSFLIHIAKVNTSHVQPKLSYSSIMEDDDAKAVCKKVFAMNLQTITDTLSMIHPEEAMKAAKAITGGDRVMIFAQGRSGVTASSLRQRLRRLNIFADLFLDPHEAVVASSLSRVGDVALGISTYGRSRTVVENLKRAKEHGAVTIAVTSYENVPLEEYADIILRTVNNENLTFGLEPSCATITQMVMLDCVYMLIYLLNKKQSDACIEAPIKALDKEKI